MSATSTAPADAPGLTSEEAVRLRAEHGLNELVKEAGPSPWRMLLAQFTSPVVLLLVGACVVSAVFGDVVDAIAIAAIVVLNAAVGFFQEYRAERAMQALRAMTAPKARVLRDGRVTSIDAVDVVPGDVLVVEAGDVVAADAKLVEAHRLAANEAALTGESAQVEKSTQAAAGDAPLAERTDSVFMGTSIARGTGRGVVVATGMRTELGKIARLLSTAEETATPLQGRLAKVSRVLLVVCVIIVAVVAAVGLARGGSALDVFLAAVSLAVAAVPEGLPAIVTIALAIGVQRMAARQALVRKLPAVETLGCATVICTDKTGTLTTGVMAVRELWGADHVRLLDVAAACCDAELGEGGRGGVGDTTELAILTEAAQRDIRRADIERERARVVVNPFDSERMRMSILRADGRLYVKGALEVLLPRCSAGTAGAVEAAAQLAARGLRVLAVAIGQGGEEAGLELVGLLGIADPPRTEAIEAVAAARAAGIQTVMITGDHPLTALAIARELGIVREGESPEGRVHARATPEDKLRIVRAWKAKGAVVAMTGDGVNDAPALREAHVGICMGKTGTEVTREASDVVLTDDNFASVVAAVREGRGIFENIRKALAFLVTTGIAELSLMLAAAVAGLPLPLLPLQLLWVNLVTSGLPALALVMDPPQPDAMRQPPRRPAEPMLRRADWWLVVLTGMLEATVTLAVFAWALKTRDEVAARNLAFSVLIFCELLRAFAARSPSRLFWELGAFSNLTLLGVVLLSVLVQIGIQHIPATQALFRIEGLTLAECGVALLLGLIPVSVLEVGKLFRRALKRGGGTWSNATAPGPTNASASC